MSEQKQPLPYANKGDLTTGSLIRHLVRLTLPMTWGIMAVISVQLVDTYFIGLLGTQELAAISFTFPVTLTMTHLLFGLTIAMSSVVSRLIGAGDMMTARRVVLHGILLAFGVSAIFALIGFMLLNPLFTVLGATPDILVLIKQYMPLWLIGSVIISIPMNGNSAIRADGDSFKPAMVMTISALINAILDPIMIFGHFGFPAMGITGAAIASLCGYSAACLLGLYFLIFDKNLMARSGLYLDQLKDSVKRLGFIALPAGLTNMVMPAVGGLVVALLARYGTEAVAAYGVASRIEAFSMLIIMALSTAMAPIIGQNWGAGNKGRVKKTIMMAIKFNLVWSLAIAALLAIFAEPIAGAFTDDPAIIRLITLFFRIVPITYGVGNLVFGWASAFNAMGKPVNALIMIFVRAIVMTIPAVWIGGLLYDVTGIFVAIGTVNVLSGLLFHIISMKQCHFNETIHKNDALP